MKAKKIQGKTKRPQAARAKANGRKPNRPVEMTMRAIERQWPDRWVLIQVTRRREHQTTAGLVLGYARRKDRKRLAEMQVTWLQEHPDVETFLFWTGELIPKGVYPVL